MGVQVSLGNRRDLTQDAKLPLDFFLCAFSLVPSLHSRLPALSVSSHWREGWVFSPCKECDEKLRYRGHICPDHVRAVLTSLHWLSHTRTADDSFWWVAITTFLLLLSSCHDTQSRYIALRNETHWLQLLSRPTRQALRSEKWPCKPVWSSSSLISLTGSS